MSLLEVRSLSVFFKSAENPVPVVSELDFEIGESEIFGLAGESGCGKSMTALSIMGILPPNALSNGSILFKGRDLLGLDRESMRRLRGAEISMIFQEPMTSLNPVLTIGYQIEEVLLAHDRCQKTEARAKAIELLRSVQIPSPEMRVREYPHQLSGGMRQRAMIAMAIACNPSLLIADEPTTALDVTIQSQILDLIQGLRESRRMSILFITHDLGVIAENATRVGIMYAGRMVETAETGEIFSNPRHPYTIGLLKSIPLQRGIPLRPIPGTVPAPGEVLTGCAFRERCGYAIGECASKSPALIQIAPGHLARCIRADEIRWNS